MRLSRTKIALAGGRPVVADVLHLPDAVVAKLPKRDLFVTGGPADGR